jgi:hypothetical protein
MASLIKVPTSWREQRLELEDDLSASLHSQHRDRSTAGRYRRQRRW